METEGFKPDTLQDEEDSDPTYEAWKPPSSGPLVWIDEDSDPTYEAWRRPIPNKRGIRSS